MAIPKKKTVKKIVVRPEVRQDMDNIKTITAVPAGYVPAKEFALKCSISNGGLTHAKNAGKFASTNLRWVKHPGRSAALYYHWDSLGPSFIRQRDRDKWPEWFQVAEAAKVLALESDESLAAGGEPTGTGSKTKFSVVNVTDLSSAKLRSEQLKIERQELELQKSKNEVLDMEEVEGLLREVSQSLRQAMLSIAPRVSPLVAAEVNPHKCLIILEEEITKVLQDLGQINIFIDSRKEGGQ